jgi:hypothetical protein
MACLLHILFGLYGIVSRNKDFCFVINQNFHMYNNQLDAQFILSLLNYHTSACFIHDRQEVECIYVANGTCYASKLTVSGPGWNIILWSDNSVK